MKSNVPWSVKGIDPEARVVAKEAARKAGMTLGEWMTSMINEVGSDGGEGDAAGKTAVSSAAPTTGVTTDQLRAVVDSLNRLNERIKTTEETVKRTEEKSLEAVGGLNQGLETVFERLKRMERERTEGAPSDILDRVEKLESSDTGRDRVESLKALEAALSQMVNQFEATRQDAIERVEQNEQAVAELETKVDGLDTRLTAGFQEVHDALDTVGEHLDHTERTAKAVMLEAREAANSTDEEFVERTSKKLQLLGNEIKRSGDQITAVETMVSSLSEKIEAAEQRSAEGIAEVASEVNLLREDVVPALELGAAEDPAITKVAAEAEETVAQLQKSYEDMLSRLEGREAEIEATLARANEQHQALAEAPTPTVTEEPSTTASADVAFDEIGDPDIADAPTAPSTAPLSSGDGAEEEFDAVFGHDTDVDEDDSLGEEVDLDKPVSEMTPREKILAAAKARKERLEKEKEVEAEDAAEADAAAMVPSFTATDGDAPEEEGTDVDENGQNRKLGLPLVILLGLLLLAMIIGAAVLFGFGRGGDETAEAAPAPSAAAISEVELTPSVEESAVPRPELLGPANVSAPDGDELYAQGKQMLAEARTVDDRVAAFSTIRQAAIYGNVPAQYRLGEMYFLGAGTDKNLDNAKRWFTEAALSGNAAAMHRLGSLAINPEIDGQNLNEALAWFERAANYGVIDSMYNLGFLYDPSSNYLPADMRDPELSYFNYGLAARLGDAQAPIDGATVAARLPTEKVTEIDAKVEQWTALPYDPAVNDGLQVVN